jgi:hypothetical protein
MNRIDQDLDNSLSEDKIKWKNQYMVDATIIGDLQRVYRIAQAAEGISAEAQKQYDGLALMLAKKVNNRGSNRIRGLDKHFLKALKTISPSLSTKWRDHRV